MEMYKTEWKLLKSSIAMDDPSGLPKSSIAMDDPSELPYVTLIRTLLESDRDDWFPWMLAEERGSEQTTKRTSKVRTICNNCGTDAFYLYTLVLATDGLRCS